MAYTPKRGEFAGQEFTTERQYRNALARSEGFHSLDAKLKAARTSEYKELVKTAKAEYQAETGRKLSTSAARHIANVSFNAPEKKEIYARDLSVAYAHNHYDDAQFAKLFDNVVGSFDRDTYNDLKTGVIRMRDIPGMADYLDYLGVDEEEYAFWYH